MENPRISAYYSPGQDIRFRMTKPEEEVELFAKARAGCETSKEFLIRNHLLFALMYANKCVKGGRLPKDEIISAANFAVMKAFQSFDHTRGIRFTAYLCKFIRGEISDLWSSKFLGTVPDPSIQLSAVSDSHYHPADHGDHDWSDATARNQTHCSADGRGIVQPNVEENDLHNLVNEAISTFEPKDQELLREIYFDGLTPTEVSRSRGLSRQAVHATHRALLAKLRRIMRSKGVE